MHFVMAFLMTFDDVAFNAISENHTSKPRYRSMHVFRHESTPAGQWSADGPQAYRGAIEQHGQQTSLDHTRVAIMAFLSTHASELNGLVGASQQDVNPAANSDEALIVRIAKGDRHALKLLYGRHHVKVYRFALRLLNDEAAAEDVVSDVFLAVWRRAGRFEGRAQVSTWIIGIARHKALSRLRARTNDPLDDDVAESIEDPADNPEATMQKQQQRAILQDCLTQLSATHREIVDLVYYHGKKIEEAASILGVPLNTVKTRMFYARKRIGELIAAKGLAPAHI
jgi:RNA polymerase sigma-70 factor, ECF subfamily